MAPIKSTPKPGSHPSGDTQNQQQPKPTTPSSTSSPAAGRKNLIQQRGHEAHTLVASTTAFTQHGVTETFGPGTQQPTAIKPFAYPTTINHHDLYGEGSQTIGASTAQHEPRMARLEETLACPYHRSILQGRPTHALSGQGLGPMDRYFAEGPSDRYAILHRPDTGNGTTHNGCRCLEIMQSNVDAKGRAQK